MAEFKAFVSGESEQTFRKFWARLFKQSATAGIVEDGVLGSGLAVAQTTTASANVEISAGLCLVQDTVGNGVSPLLNDATKTLDVLTANPMGGTPRNDIVVFDAATSTIRVIVGTPNAVPTDPSVPSTALALARLRHAASATTVPTSKIDDLRVYTTLIGVGARQYVRKGADQGVVNSTTLVNDSSLKFAAVAGATYTFECTLYVSSNSASSVSDIKVGFSFPAGTLDFMGVGANNAGLSSGSDGVGEWVARPGASSGSTTIPYALSNNSVLGVIVRGSYVCTTSGTVNLMFAQYTSGAVSSYIKAGSTILADRVV